MASHHLSAHRVRISLRIPPTVRHVGVLLMLLAVVAVAGCGGAQQAAPTMS